MKGYPAWFSALFVTAVVLTVVLTGIAMTPGFLDLRLGMEIPWRPEGSWRLMVFVGHVGFGLLLVLILGALWAVHMRIHFKQRKRVISGVINGFLILMLAATGLGLQYANEDGLLANLGAAHLLAGIFFFLLYAWHLLSSRRELEK